MAGLVPAIHVVRREERSQASCEVKKALFLRPLRPFAALPGLVSERCGVDGRDKPGMTPGVRVKPQRPTNS
jgi:hypothetical protein